MRNFHLLAAFAAATLAAPLPATAQEAAGPMGYTYATYYVCDVATQGNMDNVVLANEKAYFDKWVEDDKLIGWGYLSHFTGGRWRRAQFHVSATLEQALENQAEIFREIYAANRDGAQARAEACEAHDDYIWEMSQGSKPGTERGSASLSVYFVCDAARQWRADEIFAEIYAPQLRAMQEDGDIASWSWQRHVIGGEYQRLQTVTGGSHAAVVGARVDTLRRAAATSPDLVRELAGICNSHSDYLWDILH